GEAYTSAVSHINLMPQTVIAHARDLAAGDTILSHSHAKAQLIFASSGVMVVTTDTGAFFVPPQ
ncbi:MAG: AraC family transcriptional regulator, partial [Pseudomonadota bacterium]|nr:AraC family transcriptional regulator [Pseudomonadota bacterium]